MNIKRQFVYSQLSILDINDLDFKDGNKTYTLFIFLKSKKDEEENKSESIFGLTVEDEKLNIKDFINNLQSDKNDAFEILRYESKENANTLINIKINITKLSTKCLKYEGDKIVDKFKNAIKKIIDINDSNYKVKYIWLKILEAQINQ